MEPFIKNSRIHRLATKPNLRRTLQLANEVVDWLVRFPASCGQKIGLLVAFFVILVPTTLVLLVGMALDPRNICRMNAPLVQ